MPPSDEANETFAQWRIWIIKTLDKLSADVESLKTLTTDRHEYMRRFEVVEKELIEVREKIGSLNVSTAVSKTKMAIYGTIGMVTGSALTTLIMNRLG